jgi:hypothetical protein
LINPKHEPALPADKIDWSCFESGMIRVYYGRISSSVNEKSITNTNKLPSIPTFWRNFAQQEIDYIEERDGCLYAFEFKWNENRKSKLPPAFAETYPEHRYNVINPSNYLEFI